MPETTRESLSKSAALVRINELVTRRHRFVISSHTNPDGDSIGSQMAMACALRELGKDVVVVNRDPAPAYCQSFPGMPDIRLTSSVDERFDAGFIMECGDLSRTGVSGLERFTLVNLDHHLGNTMYGDINWYDPDAAACGEMVFDVITALGVPLSLDIATHIYLAILTDTGSFHHSNITQRTFEICRLTTEAGVDPAAMARRVFDSSSSGKLKLVGALLDSMELEAGGRLAVLTLSDQMLRNTNCTYGDTDGLINLPLTAREIQAVVLFKSLEGQDRVSLRSKEDVDVRQVASAYGGGGHKNAAGFTPPAPLALVRQEIIDRIVEALDAAAPR